MEFQGASYFTPTEKLLTTPEKFFIVMTAFMTIEENKRILISEKRTIRQNYLGTHIIAEFFGCQKLNNLSFVRTALIEATRVCGATVLHTKFHKFSPQGLTGYILLAESHIFIHTWPEYDYAAVDVFTCGLMNTEKAVEYIGNKLQAQKTIIKTLKRGKLKGRSSIMLRKN